jgi:anti-sigma factor RsiW
MSEPNGNEMNDLFAKALRGELSAPEMRNFERRLETEPALREAWLLEQRLDRALGRLPNVPVSTNFTSLVLQSVRSEETPAQSRTPRWLGFRFPRLAAGLAIVGLAGFVTLHQYRRTQNEEMARSVSSFTQVASALSPEQKPGLAFQDFEAIQRYSLPSESELDLELLAALQK